MSFGSSARLIILAAIWGSSFIFLRMSAPVLGPVVTASCRLLLSGLALLAYFRAIRFDAEWSKHWRHYLIIGTVNSAIPFTLYSFAARHIPASYSVILNSTAPMFGALFSALWLGERLTAARGCGLLLGAIGVGLVAKVGGAPEQADAWFKLGIGACLGAAACYALSGVYLKKFAKGPKAMGIAGASQIMAGLVLVPLIPLAPPNGELTAIVVFSMLWLALLCSAIANLLYYQLIAEVGPTKALTVTYLMPAFGLLWGALFLGESITLPMLAGCGLVVLGTALVMLGRVPFVSSRHLKTRQH